MTPETPNASYTATEPTKRTAYEGAAAKGWDAYQEGKFIWQHPYKDTRTDRGSVTFSRGFIRAWQNGWKDAYNRRTRP